MDEVIKILICCTLFASVLLLTRQELCEAALDFTFCVHIVVAKGISGKMLFVFLMNGTITASSLAAT
jgi:hypothetical protein